jgi:hypothetical protein
LQRDGAVFGDRDGVRSGGYRLKSTEDRHTIRVYHRALRIEFLVTMLVIELLVRLRSRWVSGVVPLPWLVVDNVRMGAVYAVVLEAFKLGS